MRWRNVRFGELTVSTHDGHHCFRVEVNLGGIQPSDVQVELYADPVDGEPPFRAAMSPAGAVDGACLYAGLAPGTRPAGHYTPRVIPRREGALIPAEISLIAWQK